MHGKPSHSSLRFICTGLPGLVMWLSQNEPTHIEDLTVQKINSSPPLSHAKASRHDYFYVNTLKYTYYPRHQNGRAAVTGWTCRSHAKG